MPHIQIDYTANLADTVIEGRLVDRVHQAAIDSGVFPVWAPLEVNNTFFAAFLQGEGIEIRHRIGFGPEAHIAG